MIDQLREAFPELTDDQAFRILAAFDRWYGPRTTDHGLITVSLIGYAAGWLDRDAEASREL